MDLLCKAIACVVFIEVAIVLFLICGGVLVILSSVVLDYSENKGKNV